MHLFHHGFLTTGPFNPKKIAPLYFLGSSLFLNFFKEKYEKIKDIFVKKFFVSVFFKFSVINFAVPLSVLKQRFQ